VLAAAIAVLAHAGSVSAAPLPSDFFGVSSPDLEGLSQAERVPILDDQKSAGVRIVRRLFDWSATEKSKGSFTWTASDSFVTSTARAGMEVLPVVLYSPTWATSCPSATRPTFCPPADETNLGHFVVTLMGRYGPSGTFWKSNPTVPKVPITSWQIWNEPNFPSYWGGTPSAAGYVQMLATVAPMMRAADPTAEIVSAGMPDSLSTGAVRLADYVTQLYAGGIKGTFDTLAVHGYSDTPGGSVGLVQQVRAIMNANGDNAVPIWMTEFGWASSGKPYRFTAPGGLLGQAGYLDTMLAQLVALHEQLNMRGLIEYMWHDGSSQDTVTDSWDNHLGLVDNGYAHKPAYIAFQGRAIHTDPPVTAFQSRPADIVTPGPQTLMFAPSEPGSDFECSLDSASFSPCSSPYGTPQLPLGPHRFAVRATDPYGNVEPSPASIGWIVALPPPPPPLFNPSLVGRDARSLARTLGKLDLAKVAAKRELVVRAAWPSAGSVSILLRFGKATIGSGSLKRRATGHGAVHLRLSATGRRRMRRSHRLRITLTETFRPSNTASKPVTASATLVLKRR
jgi:polysaccharide biosynthesis protein PslG